MLTITYKNIVQSAVFFCALFFMYIKKQLISYNFRTLK